MKNSSVQQEKKAGLFVLIGIGLSMAAILILGGKQNFFSRSISYNSHFDKIDGLVEGAKVVLGGLQIGLVKKVDFDEKSRDILVRYEVEKKYAEWIRQDSQVEIVTQGVLGDKYLSIVSGSIDQPKIEDGGDIKPGASKDLSQLFSSSEKLMVQLQSTAEGLDNIFRAFNKGNRADSVFQGFAQASKNMGEITQKLNNDLETGKIKSSLQHLEKILEKINHGQGTLGAFINDPALYDDAKAVVGQVNRNRIMRNLIRQTIKDNKEAADKSPE